MIYHVYHRYPLKKVEESKERVGEREEKEIQRNKRQTHFQLR